MSARSGGAVWGWRQVCGAPSFFPRAGTVEHCRRGGGVTGWLHTDSRGGRPSSPPWSFLLHLHPHTCSPGSPSLRSCGHLCSPGLQAVGAVLAGGHLNCGQRLAHSEAPGNDF